jgi:hypothetical protein
LQHGIGVPGTDRSMGTELRRALRRTLSQSRMSQNALPDRHDPDHDEDKGERDTAESDGEFAAIAARLLSDDDGSMCDDRREHHQHQVTRHCIWKDPAHDERDAEYDLEIEQASEPVGQDPGCSYRVPGCNTVRERGQSGQCDKQDEITKPGVGGEENVHVAGLG